MSKQISAGSNQRFSEQIQSTLKKQFPSWTEESVQKMVKTIRSRERFMHQEDLMDLVNQTYLKIEQKGKLNAAPGYFAKIFKNKVYESLGKKYLEEGGLRYPEYSPEKGEVKKEKTPKPKGKFIQYESDLGATDSYRFNKALENEFGAFDQLDSLQKINRFCQRVKKENILSKEQEKFFDAMAQAALSTEQAPNGSNWKKLFNQEVDQILKNSGILKEKANFRQLEHRLKEKLKPFKSAYRQEMMSYVDPEREKVLRSLQKLLKSFTTSSLVLPTPSYRFSVEELQKMITLKKEIFEKYSYSFGPNRFPEVYYCEVKEIKHLLPENLRADEMNPDYLGLYFDFFPSSTGMSRNDYLGGSSHEGKIVLFKDRIEAFCARNSLSEDNVRFVVLMHELGHWMSHWAISSGIRWEHGYHLQQSPSFTHEALAQLIAYWCCKGNPAHEEVLLALSPKDSAGNVDASKPYGAYESLKNFEEEVILQKLDQLRKFWMVSDLQMLAFLQSNLVDMAQWIRESKKNETGPVWNEFVDKKLGEWFDEEGDFLFGENLLSSQVCDPLELSKEDIMKVVKTKEKCKDYLLL
jgi:hypothetical protein